MEKNWINKANIRVCFDYVGLVLVLAFAYFFSARLGLSFSFTNPNTTLIWPPMGIAISALVLFGMRFWPGVFIGALIVNLETVGDFFVSTGIAVGNTLAALIAAFFVFKIGGGLGIFKKPKGVLIYAVFAGVVSAAVTATIGVSSLVLGGFVALVDYYNVWLIWWLGNMASAFMLGSFLILSFSSSSLLRWGWKRYFEFFIIIGGLIVVSLFVFGYWNIADFDRAFAYLVIPFLIWLSIRFTEREASFGVLAMTIVAIMGTLRVYGDHTLLEQSEALVFLQVFLIIIWLAILMMSSVVSERTRLLQEVKRFDVILEKSTDAITLSDEEGKIIYTSPSTEIVSGFGRDETLGKNALSFIHPEDRPYASRLLESLISEDGKSVDAEVRIKKKDDGWVWVHVISTNLLKESGVNAIVSNYRDISRRKVAEEELKMVNDEIKSRLVYDEALLNSMGEGVIATDKNGKITAINKAALRFLGWSKEDLVGRKLDECVVAENSEGSELSMNNRPMSIVLREKVNKVTNSDFYYVRQDGTRFPVAMVITPIIINHEIKGAIEVFRDVTIEKELEESQNEFISIASHQLRTPVAAINWYSEMLADSKTGKLTDKQREYLEAIVNSNVRLTQLTNELLSASRIESGNISYTKDKIDVSQLVNEVLEDFDELIEEKSITVNKEYEDDLGSVVADKNVVHLIFQNLISNAVKYTPAKGEITIDIKKYEGQLKIVIGDTGYGIPKEEQSKIFTKFFRAANAKAKEPDGTGLGLYIVKSSLDNFGGNITFESSEGKGTKFYVNLPVQG